MSQKKTITLVLFSLFLILFLIRFVHLTADPPYDLSTSGGPYGDPGGYSFNARNKTLFGSWEVDNFNMMYLSFPPHSVTYLVFRLLGIGFAQQNLVPVLFSFASLIFFFLIIRERLGNILALIGTGLLGFNYLFLMYSRIANRVMPPIFFILLGIYLLQKGKKKPLWLIGAGMSLFLALISKSVVFFAVGAVLAGYLVYVLLNTSIKEIAKRLSLLLVGALLPFIPWLFFLYIPHRDFINSFSQLNVQYLIPPKSLSLILKYFWTRPQILLHEMPVIFLLAALFSLMLLYRAVHASKKVLLVDWIFLFWFFAGFFYYAVIQQRVTRHYIPQIVPLVFLAILLAHHLFTNLNFERPRKHRLLYGLLVFLWMLFPVSMLMKAITKEFPRLFRGQIGLNLSLLILSLLMTLLLFLFLKFWTKKEKFLPAPSFKIILLILLLSASMIFQVSKYMGWALNPQFQLKEASQDFGKAFDKATLAGLWAPAVCLENEHRAHEYFQGYINDRKDFFERFNITHVFTTTAFNEDLIFERNFPQVMNRAKLLARYHIWTVEALLYDVNPVKEVAEEGLFEAELFTQKGSTPRFDSTASKKFAVLSGSKKPNYVALIISEEKYPKGNYEITFRIKKQGFYKNLSKRVARLDVVSEEIHRVLNVKDLFPKDLVHDGYQNFSLTIQLKRPLKMKLRVFAQGNGAFWVDWVRVKPLLN